MAEVHIDRIEGLTGYMPRTADIILPLPAGVTLARCRAAVDPLKRIDEINEANNQCSVSGLPPVPVEGGTWP